MRLPNRPKPGELLLARPGMEADYWDRAVVLVLDCDDDGALGVILNRTAEIGLEQVLPSWTSLVSPPQALFEGGPMSPQGAICLAQLLDPREEPPGWRRVHGTLGLLHLDTPVPLVEGAYGALRIFAGYAGWDSGQLEGELLRGDWLRVPSRDEDVFGADLTGLWQRILRRQGGALGLLSTWTDQPGTN